VLRKQYILPSGANVLASEAAQYSTLYPACRSKVHNHLSSPESYTLIHLIWRFEIVASAQCGMTFE